MSDLHIRSAASADLDRICDIAVTAWEPVYDEFRRRAGDATFAIMFPQANQCKDAQIRAVFDSHPDSFIVTECDGAVAGFATFFVVGERLGEVGNNAVHPDFQGRGIGAAQMEEVLKRLKQAGCEVVKVFTGLDPSHAPARRMYEKAGFRQWWESVTYIREL
jgi:ribosomal protein S18 acetylase RimI-like enzyme